MISTTLTTVDMNTDIQHWLEGYANQHNLTFSQAMNQHLKMAQQGVGNDACKLPLTEKLLLQSSIESLLFLKELLPDERLHLVINEKAKMLIRNTLNLNESPCLPS